MPVTFYYSISHLISSAVSCSLEACETRGSQVPGWLCPPPPGLFKENMSENLHIQFCFYFVVVLFWVPSAWGKMGWRCLRGKLTQIPSRSVLPWPVLKRK